MSMFGSNQQYQPQSQPQVNAQQVGMFPSSNMSQNNQPMTSPATGQNLFSNQPQQTSSLFSSVSNNSQSFGQSAPQFSSSYAPIPPPQTLPGCFSFSNATPQPPQSAFSFPPASVEKEFLPLAASVEKEFLPLAQPPQSKIQLTFTNDSQSSLNARPYGLNIAIGTSEKPADITIVVNNTDTFKLSSEILKERSNFFKRELEGKELDNLKLEINFPFPNMLLDFFLWLSYQDQKKLLDKIHFLHEMLEVYAIGRIFEVNPELGLGELLLRNRNISGGLGFQQLPDVWDRKYIDFKFLTKMLNQAQLSLFNPFGGGGGLFGGNNNDDGKIYYVFDWLGEKSCYSEEDIEDLKNSEEFKTMGDVLERYNFLPKNINSYATLARRYPVAIQTISVTRLLKGINMI